MMVQARINSGPMLRLPLDSGTQYVVLDRSAAVKSGCAGGKDLDLVGAGGSSTAVVKMLRAESVPIADLAMHDVPLLVKEQRFPDGIQGAMPLSIFAEFLIRLDVPGKQCSCCRIRRRGRRSGMRRESSAIASYL